MHARDALWNTAQSSHDGMGAGDFTRVGPILRALEATLSPVARAWAIALRTRLALTAPRYGAPPKIGHLADFVDGPPVARHAAVLAATDALRLAVLGFDAGRVAELAQIAERLQVGLGDETGLLAEFCRAWASYVSGNAAEAYEQSHQAMQGALRLKSAALVVEAQALRALSALEAGDVAEALSLSRRASLAARAEGLPQPEFFAHIVLARARRHARQSHLSLRILEALRSVVTDPWRGFLCWEWLMAGGDEAPALHDLEFAGDLAVGTNCHALLSLLRDPTAAQHETLKQTRTALARPDVFFPASRDALTFIAASDPTVDPPNASLAAWRSGRDVLIPAALHGLRLRSDLVDVGETAAAYVLRTSDGRAVRILHWGLDRVDPGAFRLPQSQRAQGRVETVLAVLALSETAVMPEADCFAQTYGFPFVPEVHRGVFDVLLHRARVALADAGAIVKEEHGLRLDSDRALVIPDPRVSQRTADRVLRLLSERGSASAKEMASTLGISLRAAQGALAELSEQGACDAQKRGRAVAYVVEDTVFSEPTARLRAEQLTGLTHVSPQV